MSLPDKTLIGKLVAGLLALLLSPGDASGQENAGIFQDNYTPVNSRFLNPSSIVDSWTWLDINIVGVSTYLRTNFAFIPQARLTDPGSVSDPILHQPGIPLYGYSSEMVLGPSASIVIRKNAFAFHTAIRSYIFMKNLPEQTVGFIEDSTSLVIPDGNYSGKDIRIKELTWEEYGITYGRILRRRFDKMYTGALTVNRLYGLHSAGMYMSSGELEVNNSEGSFVNIQEGSYWYNEPQRLAGKGWSASAGVTYKKMTEDVSHYIPHSRFGGCMPADYRFKIGLSLLDLGAIMFDRNAVENSFDEETPVDSIRNWTDVTEEALATAISTEYLSWLPAAISVQYDHNLSSGFFGSAALINRLTFPSWKGTDRANMLSAAIRYESKRFAASLPLTLHEYRYPQLGFSLRLWFLIIGTDQLLPFLKRTDIYSADIYFYLKIPILKSPECKKVNFKDKKARGHYRKILCPAWAYQ